MSEARTFENIVAGQPAVSMHFGATRVDILGTEHISGEGGRLVNELMDEVAYDCVALELCDKRLAALTGATPDLDLWEVIRQERVGETMTMLALSAYQQRLAEQFGSEPGAEFKAAIERAERHETPLICIDRAIGVTARRLSAAMSWWKRAMLAQLAVYQLFSRVEVDKEEIERLKSEDQLSGMFSELANARKELVDTVMHERDVYMANRIMEHLKENECGRMFVVVGAAHLPGMRTILQKNAFPESLRLISYKLRNLNYIHKRFKWTRLLPAAIVLLILFGFALGFSRGIGWSLVLDWVLINGGLAALGVLLAGGHPITVISGFIAAPLTSINPMVGAGMVTATVELTVRKPQVSALKTLRKDTMTRAGWRRNPIARTLLVFLFSTIGSVIGTYVGGIHIFSQI